MSDDSKMPVETPKELGGLCAFLGTKEGQQKLMENLRMPVDSEMQVNTPKQLPNWRVFPGTKEGKQQLVGALSSNRG